MVKSDTYRGREALAQVEAGKQLALDYLEAQHGDMEEDFVWSGKRVLSVIYSSQQLPSYPRVGSS